MLPGREGKLRRMLIGTCRYPLHQAAEAFSILQNRGVTGKLLLVTGPRTAQIRRGRL